jgi:hypothetical protein
MKFPRSGLMVLVLLLLTAAQTPIIFPVAVNGNQRLLQAADGHPFLLLGDAAWSLIAELDREEATAYLDDRAKRGFNAILVNLVEHQFSSHPPANAFGDLPFPQQPFAALGKNYFDHAAWVIDQALKRNMLVFVVPAYLGVNGGDQGWYTQAAAAGPDTMRAYGEAVARRFQQYPNIVWVLGGDFDAPDKTLVSHLAEGIAAISPGALQTVHGSRDTPGFEMWGGAQWFSMDAVYTYGDVHNQVLERSSRSRLPVILLEGAYEYERDTTARTIRRNAYGAMLGGAAGQFFGNNPVWHFSGPGVFPSDQRWRDALDSPGAQSMTVLKAVLEQIEWFKLQPDRDRLITDVEGSYAAAWPDHRLIAIYGDAGQFQVKTDAMKGAASALWVDPASGRLIAAKSPQLRQGRQIYQTPPDRHNVPDSDWLLLIGSPEEMLHLQKR